MHCLCQTIYPLLSLAVGFARDELYSSQFRSQEIKQEACQHHLPLKERNKWFGKAAVESKLKQFLLHFSSFMGCHLMDTSKEVEVDTPFQQKEKHIGHIWMNGGFHSQDLNLKLTFCINQFLDAKWALLYLFLEGRESQHLLWKINSPKSAWTPMS